MLTSYPPRECGIATFSMDLKQAVERMFGSSVQFRIAAIDDGKQHTYPREVAFVFDSHEPTDYQQLAVQINNDPYARALILQHEFGLFDNRRHTDFISMLRSINKPVVLVMHTVLPAPDALLKEKVSALAKFVDRVIVMTKHSAGLLQTTYGINTSKIAVIPHGTHLIQPQPKEVLKEKYGLQHRTVLSTFGLISRNKNIETSLKALRTIVQKYPEVIFLVLGRTHPCVVKAEGESYREELLQLVQDYHLENHVRFVNRYLTLEEMLEYLQATDIYLFTSKDPVQAVSGTFSYALSAGCAIVSTPIPHASELLENGSGLLFDFENADSLAAQVLRYLDDPEFRKSLSGKAMETMASTAWENVANRYMALLEILQQQPVLFPYALPPVQMAHLKKMTTDRGMVQFAHLQEPDLSSGYTLDDNARALIAVSMLYQQIPADELLKLMNRYLNFIKDCQLADGRFLNYRNETGAFTEENEQVNLEDANGRAVWALGYVAGMKQVLPDASVCLATALLEKTFPKLELMQSPRAIAFSIKGLFYYTQGDPSYKLLWLFEHLGEKLVRSYQLHADKKWHWFEPYLTYANSVLPEALLMAYRATKRPLYKSIAKESFDFLLSKIFAGGQIQVISNKGWLHKDAEAARYGEQPIDVAYTIVALDQFYAVYKEERYAQKIRQAYEWFLGRNHLNRIIYNPATGGCFDGLEEKGVNLNQGAESTVCHLIARLTAAPYYRYASQGGGSFSLMQQDFADIAAAN
ncbi:hypothetical protein A8C56_17620 [Niabella ginsenosidivorans]|uniref:Mannosyltransferase n=2 Tax=Niabella ginsenosidivorans TaxID=1176587 RepID=A0A1A9I780_9BACT|nr:hypothetical protein A8C56_17620 [Niabella ginsenosidivorans]